MDWFLHSPIATTHGYLVPQGARLPGLWTGRTDKPLMVGPECHLKGVQSHGSVTLGRNCFVAGDIIAGHQVVLGARCTARNIHAQGRVVLQAGCRVENIRAGSDVYLLGDVAAADVQAGGDIIVVGTPRVGDLRPAGRVITRAVS